MKLFTSLYIKKSPIKKLHTKKSSIKMPDGKRSYSKVLFCFYKVITMLLLLSVTKAMAFSQSVDVSQLPSSTTQAWQVYLQPPKQALWQGQSSQWHLISLNPPNGTADINLPASNTFTFLAGNPIAVNSKGKVGWAYPIKITPKVSGNLTLPEISLSYSSATLVTTSQQVNVSSPQITSRMQLELSINSNDIYIGQSIRLTTSWTFDFPVNALKEVNLHIPSLFDKRFSVVQPWNKADENSKKSIGLPVNGQRQIARWENLGNNQVRIFFDTVIKPNRVGQYQIEPATLLTAVINDNSQSGNESNKQKNKSNKKRFKGTQYLAYYNNQFFEALNDQEQVHRVLSKSTALILNVKALPANAPSNFSGIIGRPIIEASAQPTQVKKGEAIQYSLTIVHPDIETITIPSLTQFPSVTQSFKVPVEPSTSITKQGSSVIKQSIFPRRVDIAAIPELTLNYFEPESGVYRDLTINNLPIKVEENESFNFSNVEGSKNIILKNPVKQDPEGIWALRWQKASASTKVTINNNNSVYSFLGNSVFSQPWLLIMLLLLPPIMVALLLVKPMKQRLYQQRLKQPVTQLKVALKQGEDPLLHLSKYCYLRFGLTPSKFNTSNLKLTLQDYLSNNDETSPENKIKNSQIATDISQWLEQYQARYAQKISAISADEEKQLLTIIDKLEQCLPRFKETNSGNTKPSAPAMIKTFSSLLSTFTYLVVLGLSSYSEVIYANESLSNTQAATITIESLHRAHQIALQLSIDSPHKGSIAHGKIAEQLASFIDDASLNQASLYYDIGTSWFQATRYGESILWLRRAQNISSDDDNIVNNLAQNLAHNLEHNLAQARAKRLDQLPDNFSPLWQNQLHQAISSSFWLVICWLGYCIFWLMVWRRVTDKDLTKRKLVLSLIFVGFASITQVTKYQFKPQLSEAVITSQEVISRKGPGLIFSPAFTTPLHEGAELDILRTDGQWSEVKLTNGDICWLPSRSVSTI